MNIVKAAIMFLLFEYRVERQVRYCVSSSIRVLTEGGPVLLDVFDRVIFFSKMSSISVDYL